VDAVLPGRLGRVQRLVGCRHQLFRGGELVVDGDPEARGRVERLAARQLDGGRLEPDADPLGQLERAGKVGLGQDQRELLAAIASREVDVPDPCAENLARPPAERRRPPGGRGCR
jgi:hypothetical protein